jgi:hypothetical protein
MRFKKPKRRRASKVPSPTMLLPEAGKKKLWGKKVLQILFSVIFFGLGMAVLLLRFNNKNYHLEVESAEKMTLEVKQERPDSLLSPLCNCPNPELSQFGFLNFFKKVSIRNKADTSVYTITAPSSQNLSTYPSYQFQARVLLYRKPKLSHATEASLLSEQPYSEQMEFVREFTTDSLYFLSIVSTGSLQARFLSDNAISAFLPADSAVLTFEPTYKKYAEAPSGLSMNYKASHEADTDFQVPALEYFGPKISFLANNLVDLLGEKGVLEGALTKWGPNELSEYVAVVQIDVPFKARVMTGSWGHVAEAMWHDELLRKVQREDFMGTMMVRHVPLFVGKDLGLLPYSPFSEGLFYEPAVFGERHYDFDVTWEEPLSEAAYSEMRRRRDSSGGVFKNPSYKNGVVINNVTGIHYKVPPDLEREVYQQMRMYKKSVTFEDAREKAPYLLKTLDSLPADTTYGERNVPVGITFYYPQLPPKRGLYYYGSLSRVDFEGAEFRYSSGLETEQHWQKATLELSDLKINEKPPYHTPLPVGDGEGVPFHLQGRSTTYINSERIGSRLLDHPFVQSFEFMWSFLGIGLIPWLSQIYRYLKRKIK